MVGVEQFPLMWEKSVFTWEEPGLGGRVGTVKGGLGIAAGPPTEGMFWTDFMKKWPGLRKVKLFLLPSSLSMESEP